MTTTSGDAGGKPGGGAGILVTIRESPLAVKAMLAGVFVNKLGAFIQVFLVLFLTRHAGFSVVQAGLALSADGAGTVLGILAGGAMSDWLGPRRATLISMFGTAFLVLGVLYARNYAVLLVVVTLLGVVGVVYRPAAAALLSELTPPNRQVMIMAMYRLALNVGTTAAPLIGAALVAVSWNLLFWGEAVAALGYAVIAAFALPRHGATRPAAGGEQAKRMLGGFRVLLSDHRFGLYVFAMFINAVVYWQSVSVLPLAVIAAGYRIVFYTVLITLNGAIVIGCELLMTKVTQRWQPRTVVMAGFALLGGGMAVYSVTWGFAIFVIGTLTWTLGEIVAGPTVFAYPAMVAPDGLRGRYLGASQAMFNLGVAIGPVVGVTVWNVAGRAVWLWCGAACVVGLLCARFGMKIIPRDEPAAEAAGSAATAA